MSTYFDLRTTIEIVSARRLYLIEHSNRSENYPIELEALAVVIKSLQQGLQEYESSSYGIEEFIAAHQLHLRLESSYGGPPR